MFGFCCILLRLLVSKTSLGSLIVVGPLDVESVAGRRCVLGFVDGAIVSHCVLLLVSKLVSDRL